MLKKLLNNRAALKVAKAKDNRPARFDDELHMVPKAKKITGIPGKWIEFNARPGDVFLIKEKEAIIGDLNCCGGQCNCCAGVNDYQDVVWLRNIITKETTPVKKSWTVAAGKIHKGLECRVKEDETDEFSAPEWKYGHTFMKKVGKKFQTDDGTFKFAEVLV